MNLSERDAVILGALLHDIGKFAQRAGVDLESEYRNLESQCCPIIKGRHVHQHVLYGGQFVKSLNIPEVENLVLYHHYPRDNNINDKIIQLADWLSSGERKDKDITESVQEVSKEPLISIFSQIKINKGISEYYHPLLSLSCDLENQYPKSTKQQVISDTSYENLWKNFTEEFTLIKSSSNDPEKLIIQILFLLEKYTISIPSAAYVDKPDISLFHHLKSTAAIAVCLYDLKLTNEKINTLLSSFPKVVEISTSVNSNSFLKLQDFLLVSGDISGIQDFIYSVTTEHALKGLRGRSYYIQLISEMIAKKILDCFNLTYCNLLFCGGGHFLILLPNLGDSIEKLNGVYREINKVLYELHNGKLAAIIVYTPISYLDFLGENFSVVLEKHSRRVAIEKKRKFHNIIDTDFLEVFETGGEFKGCEICGEEIDKKLNKCQLCESYEQLSDMVKKAKYLQIVKSKAQRIVKNNWQAFFKYLGYDINFTEQKPTGGYVFKINDVDFIREDICGYKFEPFYTPEGTLEDIAKKSEGFEKYGALRMDVDNLSRIFIDGLKNKTISRISMLSYMLQLFFSVQIRNIVEKNEFKDKSLIVYSGGDDLFILGCWSILPRLAQIIYEHFKKFTCEHPDINLSGGIFIAPSSKFPVYYAAIQAGKAEDLAKQCEGKNRITFIDVPIEWSKLKEVEKVKDLIVELLKEYKVPRSLLTILYSGCEEQELLKEKKVSVVRIWRLLYAFKRLAERVFTKEKQQEKLQQLREAFIVNYSLKDNLHLAVTWADWLTRGGK